MPEGVAHTPLVTVAKNKSPKEVTGRMLDTISMGKRKHNTDNNLRGREEYMDTDKQRFTASPSTLSIGRHFHFVHGVVGCG